MVPREPGVEQPIYDDEHIFTLEVHHGGVVVEDGFTFSYKGGKVNWYDFIMEDYISLLELKGMANKLGYESSSVSICFKEWDSENLVKLTGDGQLYQLCKAYPRTDSKVIPLYLKRGGGDGIKLPEDVDLVNVEEVVDEASMLNNDERDFDFEEVPEMLKAVEREEDDADFRKKKKGKEKILQEDDGKKGRVCTEEDELAIFNGLIEYRRTKKVRFTNADVGEFHNFIKENLQLHADPVKLGYKIRRMKNKYFDKGQDQVFIKTHDIKMFQLSMEIWGVEDNGVDGSEKVAEEEKSVEKKEDQQGGAKTQADDFWSKYPSLCLCLRSQGGSDLSLILMQKFPMIGSGRGEKLEELEGEWSEIVVAEMQLCYKKYDVWRKLTQLVLDSMKE